MKLTVKIFATLTQYLSGDLLTQYPSGIRAGRAFEVDMAPGSTLDDLITYLGIPQDIIKLTFVNGKTQELTHILQPGDEVGMFPPIAGG